jgi:hypothetical protein
MLAVSHELRAKFPQLIAKGSKLTEWNCRKYKSATQQTMTKVTNAGVKKQNDQLNEIKSKIVNQKSKFSIWPF